MIKSIIKRLHDGEKRFARKFRFGQKGFTLIELLVVVAILGVLAAIAIPNIAKFMGEGREEAATTELANVQTAVIAAMVDADLVQITGGTLSATQDLTDVTVDNYVLGGLVNIAGTYTVGTDGAVTQTDYPGLP
jgi:type IV pilus assembly protein PilA